MFLLKAIIISVRILKYVNYKPFLIFSNMTMMEDVTRSRLSEKAFYGTRETNYSQDGRSVSSS